MTISTNKFRLYIALAVIIVAIIGFIIGFSWFGGFDGSNIFGKDGKDKNGPKSPVRMLFVGDMMFDRTIRGVAEFRGYDSTLSCVSDYTKNFDLVVANLEGPITESVSLSKGTVPGQPGNTTFTFDPAVAPALLNANIRMINIGNNHIYDFGHFGAETTTKYLDESSVKYFGVQGIGNSDIATSTIINGYEIAFVNYNQFDYYNTGAGNDPERTIQAIWNMRDADFVVVYAHWGDEYLPETEMQKVLAHRFIDAGADMVVGSHPHVIQSYEEYNGKPIYYSLGNFIFDQYWEESVRTGLGVEVILDSKKGRKNSERNLDITERLFDISIENGTCLAVTN